MWVHELADANARCGGKAHNLARLIAAGVPVPAGFAIDDRAFAHVVGELDLTDPDTVGHQLARAAERVITAELPAQLGEILARAAALGPQLAVRSSASIEDSAGGAAAGVFSSRTAVPAADVWDAIRAVWQSALLPLAATYVRKRDAAIAIGVIVQPFVAGERVTIYTRAPGAPTSDELLVQRGEQLTRTTRSDRDPLVQLALRAEAAIAATAGADVELVGDVVVQARPIVHPVKRAPRSPAPPAVTALLVADGRRWSWDIAHNPDPLSTAQSELVERVDQANVAPFSLRVCAGYLYSAPRTQVTAPPLSALAEIEARLAALLAPTTSLDDAVARYVQFYAIWASELSPLVATVRPKRPGERRSSVEALLLAAAHGRRAEAEVIAQLGVLAPAWDVAVPTYAERPALLHDAIERARRIENLDPDRDGGDDLADLAERDDHWFARAQQLVRHALLARAAELQLAGDDVFWLPFAALADGITGDDAKRRAAGARAAAARAARWDMPRVVGGEPSPNHEPLRGHGTGGRVQGRVVRFASLASPIVVGPHDVVVARAITPALAVLVIGCAALVSETGGLLDHGAAMARELGIACVVGCTDAWSLLDDGMLVTVDGDAGVVRTD